MRIARLQLLRGVSKHRGKPGIGFIELTVDALGEGMGDPCLQRATDLEKVRCDVNNDVPVAPGISFEVTLDGVPVTDLFAFRAQSQPGGFTLRVPDPSFLTDLGFAAGDRFPAVADGYFLFLRPLEPGEHTLNVRMINPDQSEAGVNYTLIIEDGDHN